MINKTRAISGLMLTAVFVITSCSGTGSPGSSPPGPSNAATTPSSTAADPAVFRSAAYGYAARLPQGWTSKQATPPYKWDGESELDITSAEVDKFTSTSTPVLWAAAAPWKRDLSAYTRFTISWTSRYHGDNCPAAPTARSRVTIGGQPGVLLAYDCGILINYGIAVVHGVGYWFVFKDESMPAATDRADHATFVKILRSVQFPA